MSFLGELNKHGEREPTISAMLRNELLRGGRTVSCWFEKNLLKKLVDFLFLAPLPGLMIISLVLLVLGKPVMAGLALLIGLFSYLLSLPAIGLLIDAISDPVSVIIHLDSVDYADCDFHVQHILKSLVWLFLPIGNIEEAEQVLRSLGKLTVRVGCRYVIYIDCVKCRNNPYKIALNISGMRKRFAAKILAEYMQYLYPNARIEVTDEELKKLKPKLCNEKTIKSCFTFRAHA
jgi:hypothetical protein